MDRFDAFNHIEMFNANNPRLNNTTLCRTVPANERYPRDKLIRSSGPATMRDGDRAHRN